MLQPDSGQPQCVCMQKCPAYNRHNHREVCGTNGVLYKNYCELLRSGCVRNQTIRIQKLSKCADGGARGEQVAATTTTNPTSTGFDLKANGEKCTLEQYEIMKDNLLLYSHKNLILLNGRQAT